MRTEREVRLRCETCQGYGKRLNPRLIVIGDTNFATEVHNPQRLPLLIPCEECGGSGSVHCCEGLQAQPE